MAFYRIGNGLAGKSGQGYFDMSQQQFQDCCCRGLVIKSITISVLPNATPTCRIFPQVDVPRVCTNLPQTTAGAVTLVSQFIAQSRYETRCPTPDNYCEKRVTPEFDLQNVYVSDDSFRIEYYVEDCDLEPQDFSFVAVVEKCG